MRIGSFRRIALFAQTVVLGLLFSLTGNPAHSAAKAHKAAAVTQTASAHYFYDSDSNLIGELTPNGRRITYVVDALNRRNSATIENPLPNEIALIRYRHDGNGNTTRIDETLGDGTTRHAEFSYDAFDRLAHAVDVHGKTIDYTYDAVGNQTSMTFDGQTTFWAYDHLNHCTAITVPGLGTTTFEYFPSGRTHRITRPDGSTTVTEYEGAGRIAVTIHAKGGVEISRETRRYDGVGNLIEKKETNDPLTGGTERITTYAYNGADWLTDVQSPERRVRYDYDAVGNRLREQIWNAQGTLIGDSALAYNARNELVSRADAITGAHVDLTYDRDGNLVTETDGSGTRTSKYDVRGRLLQLDRPGQPPLVFDVQSDGLRIAKRDGTTETHYHYSHQTLIAETNAIGNTLARYYYNATQLLSRTKVGSTSVHIQYLLDALGSPIVTLSQQGSVTSRTLYDAWGAIIAQQDSAGVITHPDIDGTHTELANADDQPIGFTGYYKDTESGLYYAKARYYDPRIGRFTSQDPEEGNPMQPLSLHRYVYAYANPAVYTDPSGRCADPLCAWALGYSLAKTEAEQEGITHAALNTTPALGRVAGATMEVGSIFVTAISVLTDMTLADRGDVKARARLEARANALLAYNAKLEAAEHEHGTFGPGMQLVTDFADGIGEHAGQLHVAIQQDDYVAQGQSTAALAGDATVLAYAGRKFLGTVEMVPAPGGGSGMVTTEAGTYSLSRTERRLDLIPDNDFGPINHPPREQISREQYDRLRRRSPTQEVREAVNPDGPRVDPVYGYPVDRLQGGHIVSLKRISEIPGFSQLTESQQLEVANFQPNFIGLGRRTNASMGAKSWRDWTGHSQLGPVPPDVKEAMINREDMLLRQLNIDVLERWRNEN